jgi:hypothetical protein
MIVLNKVNYDPCLIKNVEVEIIREKAIDLYGKINGFVDSQEHLRYNVEIQETHMCSDTEGYIVVMIYYIRRLFES